MKHVSTEGIEIEVSDVAACPGCAKRDARWNEVKRLLTNRMNFEREEVVRRPEIAEERKNGMLNQAIAFEFTLRLMARLEPEAEPRDE